MHRFFESQSAFDGDRVVLTSEHAHQIRHVLRMRTGAKIVVLDNRGWEYEVELESTEGRVVVGKVIEKRPAPPEPSVHLTLYQGLLKRDKFSWVLQKCTELGVARLVPMVTRRTSVRKPDAVPSNKLVRWQRIITEAAEQSRRGRVPELGYPMTFEQALDDVKPVGLSLIPWEEATGPDIRSALSAQKTPTIALFIGPEGGFDQEEVLHARNKGILPVTLGGHILRAETAALVASALVMYEAGELG